MDNKKILLVDDDRDFLWLLSKNIESWGYEVISVSSGKEALDTVRKVKVGVIVLDYLMPVMDGLATLKELRKINKKIPVIMFTSYPDKHSMETTKKLGIHAYVPKACAVADAKSSLKTAIELAQKKIRA